MLRIEGKTVGGVEVSVHSASDVKRIEQEGGKCQFTVTCGCGLLVTGEDGVKLYHLAEQHNKETGHKCGGHFLFGGSV